MFYDIYVGDSGIAKYRVAGNNPEEAIGKSRERYHHDDSVPLYADPVDDDSPEQALQPIAHDLQAAAMRMRQAYQYALDHKYYDAARRFAESLGALNLAYSAVLTSADNIGQDYMLHKKIAAEKKLSRRDPMKRGS